MKTTQVLHSEHEYLKSYPVSTGGFNLFYHLHNMGTYKLNLIYGRTKLY